MKIQNAAARFILPVMVALSVALMPVESSAQQKTPPHNAKDISATLAPLKGEVYNNPATPTGGNAGGDVTLVQFYDYRCGYCKSMEPALEQLLQEDGKIKIIYKDYPFLDDFSRGVAVAALASRSQGEDKRLKFHQLLLSPQTRLNSDLDIYKVAAAAGLDTKQLKRDMTERHIATLKRDYINQLEANKALVRKLGISAVPALIVGDYYVSGAKSLEQLKEIVAFVREKQEQEKKQ